MGEKFVSNTDCTICIEIAKAIVFKKCQYAKNGAQCQELRAHHEPVTKNSGPMPTPWHMRQSPSEGVPALVCIPHPEERLGSLRCPIAYHLSWKLHLIFPFSKYRCSNRSLEKTKSQIRESSQGALTHIPFLSSILFYDHMQNQTRIFCGLRLHMIAIESIINIPQCKFSYFDAILCVQSQFLIIIIQM